MRQNAATGNCLQSDPMYFREKPSLAANTRGNPFMVQSIRQRPPDAHVFHGT